MVCHSNWIVFITQTWYVIEICTKQYKIKFALQTKDSATIKVIIEKSRGEVSLIEQDTIENVSNALSM